MTIVLRQVILKRLRAFEVKMTFENLQHAHRQALQLLQTNSVEEAKKQLIVLANLNFPPAMTDLAMILLMETCDDESAKTAINYLLLAEVQNYSPAIYYLAMISISDATLKLNWQDLNARLKRCCVLENSNALCDIALLFSNYGSDQQKKISTNLLELSALKGNKLALALLAERLANGFLCEQDIPRANSIKRIALQAKFPVSAPDLQYGFSSPEPKSLPSINLNNLEIDTQLSDSTTAPVGVADSINLKQFPHFISAEESFYIQCMGAPFIKPSVTVDDVGHVHRNKIRSSFEFMFQPENESVYLKLLQRRMAKLANIPLKNAEQLILLRYTAGQEYKPHRDYLPPSHFVSTDKAGPGQRISTVITYLNSPESGGETAFPLLHKKIEPMQGNAICFDNINFNGELNETSLHAGLPVQEGVKWICTLWLRQSTYRSI